MAPPARMWRWVAIGALTVVIIDLATKAAAFAWETGGDGGLIAPQRNDELALKLVSTSGPLWVLLLLAVGTSLAAAHAVVLARRGQLPPLVVGIGLGGIAGNAIDRFATGAVHDFIDIGRVVANVADFAILAAIATYLISVWRLADADSAP